MASIVRRLRRWIAARLLVDTGLRDYLLARLLPDDFQLSRHLTQRLTSTGLHARQSLVSMVFSTIDSSQSSTFLIDLALHVAERARTIGLEDILSRLDVQSEQSRYVRT